MKLPTLSFLFLIVLAFSAITSAFGEVASTDLSGEWRFAMDPNDTGVKESWFAKPLADKIKLPGILQAQGFGDDITIDTPWVAALPRDMRWYLLPQYAPYTKPGNVKMPYLSQPPKHYLGVAWYQRDIDIPQAWQGDQVRLFLERARWGVTAWIDSQQISGHDGPQDSLVAPDEFGAGAIAPGKHVLSIRVDNRMSVVPGYRPDGHSVSDALGGTWNGIVGRIELQAFSPVYIDDAQVFPNLAKKTALIKVHIANISGKAGSGTLSVDSVATIGADGMTSWPVQWTEKGGDAQINVPMPNAPQWDEFHPAVQNLTVGLKGEGASDSHAVSFGMREISHDGKKLLLNGHEIDLRFTHSGGDFPLTGYPAMDVAAWKKIIQTCKDYGLNGFRFHSWCPPDAAFEAADELGFYIQPEAGMWNNFTPDMVARLELETKRIERAYGNHPSFIMLSPSNEPAGNYAGLLPAWASEWSQNDPRRLYSGGTGRAGQSPAFTYGTSFLRGPRGWFGNDYGPITSNIPVMGHEVGQWCVYPDFDVIKKFTGYLQPGNYEIWRDFAAEHGVLGQNKELALASGKFSEACYKQEIEANLRTPDMSGLVLLDLHDYLGQGGALIGMLDTFWDSKGIATGDEFKRFAGPVVPLARLRKYIYQPADSFTVPVELANYSEGPIPGAQPYWKIVDLSGKAVVSGTLATRDLPIGKSIQLGEVTTDLKKLPVPAEYRLVVGLSGTSVENDWNFWVYNVQPTAQPAQLSAQPSSLGNSVNSASSTNSNASDVLETSDWNAAQSKLATGGKVFFTPLASMLDATCPPLANKPIFWNRVMNNSGRYGGVAKAGFLGLLVDAKSPALAEFPTEGFCDWQWAGIISGVQAINLESVPNQLIPTVQAIDDWNRGYKLGVVFECSVGKGKLLVSAISLPANSQNLTTLQLRKSLLDYAASNKFAPTMTLTADEANALWPSTRPAGYKKPAAPSWSTMPGANPGDVVEPQ
jgi:beta-galactosidase